jgi:hypothetical protein
MFDAPPATLVDAIPDVLVRDGTIAAVGRSGMNVSAMAEMDSQGATLLPGKRAELWLVTAIRRPASMRSVGSERCFERRARSRID